jgi:1-aminocyclopropane-1-carboxylate deaminase
MVIPPLIPPKILPEKLSGWPAIKDIEVSVLRLDKIHEAISGNKWLKLQGWLAEAEAMERYGIMTAGGPWSNHIHAAAAFCYLHHLPFHAIIKGKNEQLTPMLQDVISWNGKITWVNYTAFKDDNHWQHEAKKTNQQWVPMGGDGQPGETGVTLFFNQFKAYHFNEIWCPIGTGTTIAGIAASAIGTDSYIAFDPGINDKKVHEKLNALTHAGNSNKIMIRQMPGQKFGRISTQVLENMNHFFKKTGVPTDIIYTGKMIDCLMREMIQPINCEKKSILVIHTGGLQGNRSLDNGVLKFMR